MPILKSPENPKTKTAPTPFKIGDRVCCPDEYGPEILEVVKFNRFDDELNKFYP